MSVGEIGNGAGNYLRIAADVPASSVGLAACGWARNYAQGGGAQFQCLYGVSRTADDSDVIGFFVRNNNGLFGIDSDASLTTVFTSQPVNGQPFFWFLTNAGTGGSDLRGGWARWGDREFVTITAAGTNTAPEALWLLSLKYSSSAQGWNGSVEDVRIYETIPTDPDLLQIMYTPAGRRANVNASLYGHWPLRGLGDLKDVSGNGHHWTATGGLYSDEQNRPRPRYISKPKQAASGAALAGTIAAAASTSGTLTANGVLAGTAAGALSSTAALAANGALIGSSDAALSSTGSLFANGALVGASAAALASTAVLVGSGKLVGSFDAALSSTAALAANGSLAGSFDAALSATGTLLANGVLVGSLDGVLSATGRLDNGAGAGGAATHFFFGA